MVRITKVYTRQGDQGETRLAGGQTLTKDHARIEAYGTVDELSSAIGVALAAGVEPQGAEILARVQNDLFHLGSDLAVREEDKAKFPVPTIEERHVSALEAWIDELNSELPPLENFVLPGGSPGGANLHVARCVCRRAERRLVTLRRKEAVPAYALRYLNRLSDLLFVLARWQNRRLGAQESIWDSHA